VGLFGTISRIGDGLIWYVLILAWPLLARSEGFQQAAVLALTALISVSLYAVLKRRLKRPRPYATLLGVNQKIYALDEFSFPSGHTMNALSISTVACIYLPWLALILLPLCALIAASRVVLGVHYPSDVLAGAALGIGTAAAVLKLAAFL